MVRILISEAAFAAIAAMLPIGSAGMEAERDASGQIAIWVECKWVDQLSRMRGEGESFSDVILRISRPEP